MKKIIFGITFGVLLCWSNNSYAVLVNFDDLSTGNYGNTLKYGNAFIKAFTGSHLQVTDNSSGFGEAHSEPNKLTVWSDFPGDEWPQWRILGRPDPNFTIHFDSLVSDLDFWVSGIPHDQDLFIYAGGELVEDLENPVHFDTLQDHPDFAYDTTWRHVQIPFAVYDIAIRASTFESFNIDDIRYNPVPEPTSIYLLGSGLLYFGRRRKLNCVPLA